MTRTNNQLSPKAIRRHIYELIAVLVIMGLSVIGYTIWQKRASDDILRLASDYHLNSNVYFLKAIDALHHLQIRLDVEVVKREINPAIQSAVNESQPEFNTSISLYQIQQAINAGLELQHSFADNRFDSLSSKLERQLSSFANSSRDHFLDGAKPDSLIAHTKSLLVSLRQLVRLHTVVRDDLLILLETKERRRIIVIVTLVSTFVLVGLLAIRRNLAEINSVITRHGQAEQALLGAQQQAKDALASQNMILEQTVERRTQELLRVQEQLIRKDRLTTLGQIAGIVSHELRNPLATIGASVHTLRQKMAEEQSDQDQILARIERNVIRCDGIIEELLDFSRARQLRLTMIDFDAWLTEILAEHGLPERIAVQRELHSKAMLSIDKELMRSAIVNLLNNAADALTLENGEPQPGSEIRISTSQSADRLIFQVEDNGCGIPTDALPQVFEPLYSTKSFGIGLGMTIVKRTVEQLGGKLELESEPNSGTKCTISLPLPPKR